LRDLGVYERIILKYILNRVLGVRNESKWFTAQVQRWALPNMAINLGVL
jgi:hypothetical protein